MSSFAELQEQAYADLRRPEPPKSPAPVPPPAEAAAPLAPAPAPSQAPSPAAPAPSAHTPPPPEVKLSVTKDATQTPDDTAARQAHEAAEAKRKADFDAKQAEKNAARQEQLDRIAAMSDEDVTADAVKRIGADTERLTRRNMKEAVCEHIQALCRQDAAFARRTMAPEKSMINCFQYINRKAQEYAEQEMKDNGIERRGVYGLDVPDGLCYQWAEDYYNDPDAKEDHKDDEKFVPQPYVPTGCKKAKGKTAQKPSGAAKPKAEKPADTGMEQISLM